MCIKALLYKINISLIVGSFCLASLNANEISEEESQLLLKQAVLKLYSQNKELEKRIIALEDKLGINEKEAKKATNDTVLFSQRVKKEFSNGKKIVLGELVAKSSVYAQPSFNAKKVNTLSKGAKVYIKGIEEKSDKELWYKLDDGIYIHSNSVSFRSKK